MCLAADFTLAASFLLREEVGPCLTKREGNTSVLTNRELLLEGVKHLITLPTCSFTVFI
jgi:hypothetical protein